MIFDIAIAAISWSVWIFGPTTETVPVWTVPPGETR